jgi:transposase
VDRDVVERLSRGSGLSVFSASALIAELGDAGGFLGEKQVGAYAGFVSFVGQIGRRRWMGGITKYGSRWLRSVFS